MATTSTSLSSSEPPSKSSTTTNSTTSLPSHPTAVAFFAALDGKGNNIKKRQSDAIQKRCQTLGWRNRHSQDEFYPISVVCVNEKTAINFSVRQVQRGEVEGTYGTGATVWPAAVVLLKYMERHARNLMHNKTVVDLGSGTGITSIGAALLGAKHVICTDGCANVVQLAKDNIHHAMQEMIEQKTASQNSDSTTTNSNEKNESFATIQGCTVVVQEYWWGKGSIDFGNKHDKNNNDSIIVLVADCVLPKLYPIAPLVQAIDELLNSANNSMAILSYEHRYYPEYDPRDKFRELANDRGLEVNVIPTRDHHSIYSVEDIEIWQVVRR